jgi:hypothetical protein
MSLSRRWTVLPESSWRRADGAVYSAWTEADRNTYLLKEVGYPLSADRYISPDVPIGSAQAVEMKLGLLDEPGVDEEIAELAEPPTITGCTLVGYDVCDEMLLSGLMDCGYDSDERVELAREFGPKLNRWHLFDSVQDADRFRAISNVRVPEHAPFQVVALYVRPVPP